MQGGRRDTALVPDRGQLIALFRGTVITVLKMEHRRHRRMLARENETVRALFRVERIHG